MLGDGRSVIIAELEGETGRIELSLKGAGRTPYSRDLDGRSDLGTCVRELFVSEALNRLAIPSSRVLAIQSGDEKIARQGFVSAAMLLRSASTHIRIGNFEKCYFLKDKTAFRSLTDFVIKTIYPECGDTENPIKSVLTAFTTKHAQLIASWQAQGFIHGVLNTDNISLAGESFDLTSGQFMQVYQPNYTNNPLIDEKRLYAFNQQPMVGLWHINCLARCFSLELTRDEIIEAISRYERIYLDHYLDLMRKKLGLLEKSESDRSLIELFLDYLEKQKLDYNTAFNALMEFTPGNIPRFFTPRYEVDQNPYRALFQQLEERLLSEKQEPETRLRVMRAVNSPSLPDEEGLKQFIDQFDGNSSPDALHVFLQETLAI